MKNILLTVLGALLVIAIGWGSVLVPSYLIAKSTFVVCDKLGYVDICRVEFFPIWRQGVKDGKN